MIKSRNREKQWTGRMNSDICSGSVLILYPANAVLFFVRCRLEEVEIICLKGNAAGRTVLLGFAAARELCRLSFADVLDEDNSRGYQRRLNARHSLDFRRYIQRESSTTIPLTFNLRPRLDGAWRISDLGTQKTMLVLDADKGKLLAQVDCQHRLGHLSDLDIELPFMCFIGLAENEEMEIFNIINGKARGLNTSLLDFHDAQLANDLASDRPELFIALYLKNEANSPWYQQLDLGGSSTSGMTRRASLRTLQKAIKRFLAKTRLGRAGKTEIAARAVLDFWSAVTTTLPEQWANPRKYLITKGIGVYALMDLAADIWNDAPSDTFRDKRYFTAALADFVSDFDWSTDGPLKGLGGESGVKEAVTQLRAVRHKTKLRIVGHG